MVIDPGVTQVGCTLVAIGAGIDDTAGTIVAGVAADVQPVAMALTLTV